MEKIIAFQISYLIQTANITTITIQMSEGLASPSIIGTQMRPLETPQTSQHYDIEGFKEAPELCRYDAERRQSLGRLYGTPDRCNYSSLVADNTCTQRNLFEILHSFASKSIGKW